MTKPLNPCSCPAAAGDFDPPSTGRPHPTMCRARFVSRLTLVAVFRGRIDTPVPVAGQAGVAAAGLAGPSLGSNGSDAGPNLRRRKLAHGMENLPTHLRRVLEKEESGPAEVDRNANPTEKPAEIVGSARRKLDVRRLSNAYPPTALRAQCRRWTPHPSRKGARGAEYF